MKNIVPRFVRDFNKVLAQILCHLLWCYVWNSLAPFEKTHDIYSVISNVNTFRVEKITRGPLIIPREEWEFLRGSHGF